MLSLVRQRVFVFTILWIGFLLAISFMEAPLKFQAPSLTLPVGLEIGYLVFHALNGIELVLAAIIGAVTFSSKSRLRSLTAVLIFWLLAQTILLYTKLDERTLAIINGETVPEAPYHLIYIGMEVVKLFMLLYLAHAQIEDNLPGSSKLPGR
ncbi:MAG: hypothetical protein AAF614_31555 [Chloroflexota bacterium]